MLGVCVWQCVCTCVKHILLEMAVCACVKAESVRATNWLQKWVHMSDPKRRTLKWTQPPTFISTLIGRLANTHLHTHTCTHLRRVKSFGCFRMCSFIKSVVSVCLRWSYRWDKAGDVESEKRTRPAHACTHSQPRIIARHGNPHITHYRSVVRHSSIQLWAKPVIGLQMNSRTHPGGETCWTVL